MLPLALFTLLEMGFIIACNDRCSLRRLPLDLEWLRISGMENEELFTSLFFILKS